MPTHDPMSLPSLHNDTVSDLHGELSSRVRSSLRRADAKRLRAKRLYRDRPKGKRGATCGESETGRMDLAAPVRPDQNYRDLYASVINAAIQDYNRKGWLYHQAYTKEFIWREAKAWIESHWFFEMCCEVVDLSPVIVRRAILEGRLKNIEILSQST